jgi:hypothetical protein
VLGPDGLSRTAILYAFDLIEYDGEDLRRRPFLDRKAALAQLLSDLAQGWVGGACPSGCQPAPPTGSSSGSFSAVQLARMSP